MTIVKQTDLRNNIKKYFDLAFFGENIIIPRKDNKNVVVISEKEYKEFEIFRNNYEYEKMLKLSRQQIKEGNVINKTIEELEEMAK